MSYQEKRTIVSIVTSIIILASYVTYLMSQYKAEKLLTNDIKSMAGIMLIFIGIGIAANIIIQIVFHILLSIAIAVKETAQNEKCSDLHIERVINVEMKEDEMDKLIELKASKTGFIVASIGFIAALLSLVLDYTPMVMINIIFIAFFVGSLLEGCTSLYYYKKGV